MHFLGDLLWLDADGQCHEPGTAGVPTTARQVWLDRTHGSAYPLVSILLDEQDDAAFRIGIATFAIGDGEVMPSILCEHRLEVPDPPARNRDGAILPFSSIAALS